MERTLSVDYPVLRQNKPRRIKRRVYYRICSKKTQSLYSFLYILLFLLPVLMYNFVSFGRVPWCFSNVFNNTTLFCLSTGQSTLSVLSFYLVSSLLQAFRLIMKSVRMRFLYISCFLFQINHEQCTNGPVYATQ